MANHHHRKTVVSPDLALASDVFDKFCGAATLKTVLGNYRHLCEILHIKPTNFPQFYPKLKSKLCSWRAQALWNKFDKRANHKCYNRGKACPNTRVLIIGAGPCGLRAAIEAQLLGAKVVVVEKRDRISRNNVLHLWPFVIQDLRTLGAKKFFGKFCAGSIDHISIRQLQCILLKVALLLGVEIHEGISFESLIPPCFNQDGERSGWRAKITPEDHPVAQYEFDVLIGADGKRNTLEGFKRKEFRGKLAIAITANFINHHTEAEARVEEISGVAYIFNQKFFKDLRSATGIDLENIVYYKDDTHYFVMTAKKHSLLNKGVILNDYADTAKLLAIENISKDALMEYAREAADFSTGYKLPQLQFAVNHYGQPDVAMFDFTSMYAAENASRVLQQNGFKLLMCLVGDSLLEPFWPTGSGCARGFLSSMDACWAVRSWGSNAMNALEVLAERESIYRLLNQTTPENLSRDIANYTLDPHTRYPNLNTRSVLPIQVKSLYSSDDVAAIEQCLKAPTTLMCDYSKKRRRKDMQIHHDVLLSWLKRQVALYGNVRIDDTCKSFKDGLALCAIIHRYRPDLIEFNALDASDVSANNQLAFDILEKEYGILPVMTGVEMEKCDVPDNLTMLSYLTQVYDIFRGEIPYTHQKMMEEDDAVKNQEANTFDPGNLLKNSLTKMTQSQKLSFLSRLTSSIPRKRYRESRSPTASNKGGSGGGGGGAGDAQVPRKPKKRKSGAAGGFVVDSDIKGLQDIRRNPMEENFSGRVKDIETKLKEGTRMEKKPKDLMRAIGKIEKTDWNVKEIEKKIEECKYGKQTQSTAAKVPKWNKQQFDDKFTAVKKKLIDKVSPSTDTKYAAVDNTLKRLEQKLRNGTALEQGQRGANKVSAMAAQLTTLHQQSDDKNSVPKSSGRNAAVVNSQGGSEICHFCNKRVYLMERLSAEGRFFHRGCFRCEYCGISLRLGNYSFDRDGKYGSRFYCTQHFGYPGVHRSKLKNRQYDYRTETNAEAKGTDKTPTTLKMKYAKDTTDTPERVGFENLDVDKEEDGHVSRNEMDEDEWTDHNFGTSANELASSDDVSDLSESEDENDDEEFAQALDIPQLDDNESLEYTRRFGTALPSPPSDEKRKSSRSSGATGGGVISRNKNKVNGGGSGRNNDDSDSSLSASTSHRISYHEFGSDDESYTPTGEKVAGKSSAGMKCEEVRLEVPHKMWHRNRKDTYDSASAGSDTEVASNEYSVSSDDSEIEDEDEFESDSDDDDDESSSEDDSATEISTDSEFERNSGIVIKSEIPDIVISESLPTRCGHLDEVKMVQMVSGGGANRFSGGGNNGVMRSRTDTNVVVVAAAAVTANRETKNGDRRLPFVNPNRGDYYLNRTQSTEGVASKISLELKKKYLLGNANASNTVQKSESTSVLDTKFKSLMDQISEHQKLLNPAPEPSVTMQAFLDGSDKLRQSSLSPTTTTAAAVTTVTNARKTKELSGMEDFQHICSLSNFGTETEAKTSGGGESKDSQAETDDTTTTTTTTTTTSKTLVDERPRGPIVFETSIVVPKFPVKGGVDDEETTAVEDEDNAGSCDASTASSADEEEDELEEAGGYRGMSTAATQISLPKVEIHNSRGELLPQDEEKERQDEEKSTTAAQQQQQRVMAMPVVSERPAVQILRHVSTPSELFTTTTNLKRVESKTSFGSEKSSPSTPTSLPGDDNTMAIFTETELSDWARDEDGVSENFDDLILGTTNITYRRHQKPKKRATKATPPTSNRHRTGGGGGCCDLQRHEDAAAVPPDFVHVCGKTEKPKPPPFALAQIDDADIEFMDTGEEETTPEDGCEYATVTANPMYVRNSGYIEYVTSEDEAKTPLAEAINAMFPPPVPSMPPPSDDDDALMTPRGVEPTATDDFDHFVHRLQDRITPFGNVKDSIDVRKSRKNSKSIEDSVPMTAAPTSIVDEPPPQQPLTKLEELSRERCKQKNLIHEMVMSKLHAEGKNMERRAKRSGGGSRHSSSSHNSLYSQPGRTSTTMAAANRREEEERSENKENIETLTERRRNGGVATMTPPTPTENGYATESFSESFSLPDIRKAVNEAGDAILTPTNLTSAARLEILKSTESIRQQARTRARLMSDSELGLSPEEKLKLLKQKIATRKAVQSAYIDYPRCDDYVDEKTSSTSFSNRVLNELQNAISEANSKTDDQSLSPTSKLAAKNKDRRRSIIQAVSDFFMKKSPTKGMTSKEAAAATVAAHSTTKKHNFKMALTGKERSKSADDVFNNFMGRYNDDKTVVENAVIPTQQTYVSDSDLKRTFVDGFVPPRPPSPTGYIPSLDKSDENLSIATVESRDDNSTTLSSCKQFRSSNRKTKRENQKKLRMAQEIQRQLEEIEVKQKELEYKGVNVEKALRNKNKNSESDFELMQELLNMIRERNELRKYEQKLLLKAKEIEAEDPY